MRQALGLESIVESVGVSEISEADVIRSEHEVAEVSSELTEVQQDIKAVSSYHDLIERIEPDASSSVITTEAIYIGIERILNKHNVYVDEVMPSLENWSINPNYTRTVSLEKAEGLLAGLKEKGRQAIEWIIKKFREWRDKIKAFFNKIFKKKIEYDIKKTETKIKETETVLKKATPEKREVIVSKIKEKVKKEVPVEPDSDPKVTMVGYNPEIIMNLDPLTTRIITEGMGRIKQLYGVMQQMMFEGELFKDIMVPTENSSSQEEKISKIEELFDRLTHGYDGVFFNSSGKYRLQFLRGEITVTPDGSEPLHNSMVNGNPLLPARTNGKTFTLNLASAKVLMDEVKELIDLFGEAIANDIAIKELESQKNEIHEYNSAGINLVKFAIEGMMETINDAKLAIESRMKVLSAFNVDLDSLDQYLS